MKNIFKILYNLKYYLYNFGGELAKSISLIIKRLLLLLLITYRL